MKKLLGFRNLQEKLEKVYNYIGRHLEKTAPTRKVVLKNKTNLIMWKCRSALCKWEQVKGAMAGSTLHSSGPQLRKHGVGGISFT